MCVCVSVVVTDLHGTFVSLKGYDMAGQSSEKKIRLMSGETVSDIYDSTTKGEEGDFVVRVVLGSGETVECDVVVCATGVVPNAEYAQNIVRWEADIIGTDVKF